MYCASPDYLALRGTPLQPDDLAQHDCLPYGHGRQVQWRFKGKVQALNVSGRMRVNNGELLRDTAIAGLGVTYLPTFIVGDALKDGRLITILDDFAPRSPDLVGGLSPASAKLAAGAGVGRVPARAPG